MTLLCFCRHRALTSWRFTNKYILDKLESMWKQLDLVHWRPKPSETHILDSALLLDVQTNRPTLRLSKMIPCFSHYNTHTLSTQNLILKCFFWHGLLHKLKGILIHRTLWETKQFLLKESNLSLFLGISIQMPKLPTIPDLEIVIWLNQILSYCGWNWLCD